MYEQSHNFDPIRQTERERERKLYPLPIDLCGGSITSARFTGNLEPWWNEANLSQGLIDKFVVGANVKMSMSMFLRLVYGGRYVASISPTLVVVWTSIESINPSTSIVIAKRIYRGIFREIWEVGGGEKLKSIDGKTLGERVEEFLCTRRVYLWKSSDRGFARMQFKILTAELHRNEIFLKIFVVTWLCFYLFLKKCLRRND